MVKTKILLVDDNPLLCDALRFVLEAQPDLQVVGVAHTGTQAIQLARTLTPHVAVLDVTLPDIPGREVARALKALGGELKILALSALDDERTKTEMVGAGADAYVAKHVDSKVLMRQLRQLSPSPSHSEATEIELLRLFGEGYRRQEIAASLGLDLNSVDQLRLTAMHKRGLKSRSEVSRFVADLEAAPPKEP